MISILVGLVILIALAYLGWSIIWVAPIAAGVVALLSGLDFFDAYTNTYMGGFVQFVKDWFPIFLLGAIFGKLMEVTGSASSIAKNVTQFIGKKRAILGVVIAAAILTYGGVSTFVVIFAIYPIALELFKQAIISRILIIPAFALGAYTFTMTALPGSPQIHNLIPMKYFDTTPMDGIIIGIVATLIMAVGGYVYLIRTQKKFEAKGEVFVETSTTIEEKRSEAEEQKVPHWLIALIPLLLVIVFLNVVKWEALYALLIGIVGIMILNYKNHNKFVNAINVGGQGFLAIINTSAAVGFGAVIAAVPAFDEITSWLFNISENPLVAEALSMQVMSMITGSASGGMGIVLSTLGDSFVQMAHTSGISLEAMHRIGAMAAGATILPNNGAFITLLAVTGLTQKQAYKHVFMVTLLIPTIAVIVGIIMGAVGIV